MVTASMPSSSMSSDRELLADRDPLGFQGGDYNLTRYVGNSPTNATDSTGMESDQQRRERERYRRFMDDPNDDMPVIDFGYIFNDGRGMTDDQYELFKQGCQGLAGIRVGIDFLSPKRGSRAFTSWDEAKWVYDELQRQGRSPQLVAIQTGNPYFTGTPVNRPIFGPTEINPNQIDLGGSKNFATWHTTSNGTGYWEHVDGSWLNNPGNRSNCNVIHSPTLPGGYTTTTYVVIPGKPAPPRAR